MSVTEIERAFNRFLLRDKDSLDERVANLISALALHIINKPTEESSEIPPGFISTAEFLERYPIVSASTLRILAKANPNSFFFHKSQYLFFDPKATLEALKRHSSTCKMRIELWERNGLIKI